MAAYKLFIGDRAATLQELRRVEQIVVEQEMGLIWEARIKMYICLDENGHWRNQPDEFATAFSRVRVELQLGEQGFVPLIDGPVAGFDSEVSAEPGLSTVSLMVRDDSVLLNREEETEIFNNRTDDAVARELFGRFSEIGSTDIEPTETTHEAIVRRSTVMQFLRKLAQANAYQAYVLPGEQAGSSIGCFKANPTESGTLPPLVLLGADRNLHRAVFSEDSEGPERTRAHSLTISDQQVISSERSVQDETLLGQLPAVPEDLSALRELPPEDNDREDPASRTQAQNREASYAYRMVANVMTGCYNHVLSPYQMVAVQAGDLPQSGNYLITKVTHRITPSFYSQELEAKRDARSDPAADATSLAGSTGLSVDFSSDISVF